MQNFEYWPEKYLKHGFKIQNDSQKRKNHAFTVKKPIWNMEYEYWFSDEKNENTFLQIFTL
jgi:hypothetical protein